MLANMLASHTDCSRVEQSSIIKFLLVENCNPCEIYAKFSDIYKQASFIKKYQQMSKMQFFHYELESKRQFIEWKHTDIPVKKKLKMQRSVKKILHSDTKGPSSVGFLEKVESVNSASYFQLFKQNSPYLLNYHPIYISNQPTNQPNHIRSGHMEFN